MAPRRLNQVIAVACGAVFSLASCGGEAASTPDLSPAALEGRGILRNKGCASCHGSNGGGGVGPELVGLFGSDVAVEIDGEPAVVTADRAYLAESITDPSAKIVDGYSLPMPRTELTQAEIDAIITYIEALAPSRSGDGVDE